MLIQSQQKLVAPKNFASQVLVRLVSELKILLTNLKSGELFQQQIYLLHLVVIQHLIILVVNFLMVELIVSH